MNLLVHMCVISACLPAFSLAFFAKSESLQSWHLPFCRNRINGVLTLCLLQQLSKKQSNWNLNSISQEALD